MEKRKVDEQSKALILRFTELPSDFLKMVNEVFTTNFDDEIKALAPHARGVLAFASTGALYSDEVILSVSITEEAQMAATTVHASLDFDPKASAPTAQDLLSLAVDAIGEVFHTLIDVKNEERMQQILAGSLGALDGIPLLWTQVQVEKKPVFVKIDKSNPTLEHLADDWLKKHDPEVKAHDEEEHLETEGLFVTGKDIEKKMKRGPLH